MGRFGVEGFACVCCGGGVGFLRACCVLLLCGLKNDAFFLLSSGLQPPLWRRYLPRMLPQTLVLTLCLGHPLPPRCFRPHRAGPASANCRGRYYSKHPIDLDAFDSGRRSHWSAVLRQNRRRLRVRHGFRQRRFQNRRFSHGAPRG